MLSGLSAGKVPLCQATESVSTSTSKGSSAKWAEQRGSSPFATGSFTAVLLSYPGAIACACKLYRLLELTAMITLFNAFIATTSLEKEQ